MSDYGRDYRGLGRDTERTYANVKEIDSHFGCYEHLRHLPRQQEGLEKLRKIASLVKPIMRKRGWRIGALAEFLPDDTRLLGLNINQTEKICIRLRYTPDPSQFLATETVVDTLLHELSHVVHGAHDGKFHALWNELRDEHYSLSMKGYTGEGFLGQGRKLGGGKRLPLSEMSRQARANAAEKRGKVNKDAGGRRLGGMPVMRGADMRKVIADAATRRITITQGCASGTKDSQKLADQASKNGFRTKAEEDDANDRAIAQALMELMEEEEGRRLDDAANGGRHPGGLGQSPETGLYIEDDDDDIHNESQQDQKRSTEQAVYSNAKTSLEGKNRAPTTRDGRPISRLVFETESHATRRRSPAVTPVHQPQKEAAEGSNSSRAASVSLPSDATRISAGNRALDVENWTCPVCTLENPMQYLCCDACGVERSNSLVGDFNIQGTSDSDQGANARHSGEAQPAIRSSSVGWTCRKCGNFMENKWWTCARCGTMEASS